MASSSGPDGRFDRCCQVKKNQLNRKAHPVTDSHPDSFRCRKTLVVGDKEHIYFSLPEAAKNGLGDVSRLPGSLKVVLENLLRHEDNRSVTANDIRAVAAWMTDKGAARHEIAYRPARVLMQDFTGVPAVVDLAAMRDAAAGLGGDVQKINPQVPVDLVIDHSVMVDFFGTGDAFSRNVNREYERNGERYEFLKWGQSAFDNFRVVPPGTGICHQVNLEYLAQTVWTGEMDGQTVAYPDTLVGTDSHTTMVNGLAVLGWGVGGIEAEAAMLGQPITMVIPEVIGLRFSGQPKEGITATDIVLTVTEMLRARGVVGKFVEFFGPGLDLMSLEDKATIANMAPEYGATCGYFPVDDEAIAYLETTGRAPERVALVSAYSKIQGLYRDAGSPEPVFTDTLELDLGEVVPSIAGPKRPQDRIALDAAATGFSQAVQTLGDASDKGDHGVKGRDFTLSNGDVVIAAITSCTNTSNPSVLIAAGLVARKARELGLKVKPWVKTSLAPGSQVVTDYLTRSGLQDDLDGMGFNLVGYGCTTCIGNSGPLAPEISKTIHENNLVATSVLSGNRNFEGRVNPDVKANYLASPPLVVAYALAGSMTHDIVNSPLGTDKNGQPVYLRDIWPSSAEVKKIVRETVTADMFETRYSDVFKGDEAWQKIEVSGGETYNWRDGSTYIQNPPYFEGLTQRPKPVADIAGARILGLFENSITTDHISPAGSFKLDSPAGQYLRERQVAPKDFNSYGARRGNHEVMMRGTFANIRIKNQMVPGVEGGFTLGPDGKQTTMFEAAMAYVGTGTPLVVLAGKEYGTGSSRDWAAKGARLLGVRAVIAESFERIHRSNLIGMGVLPLQFSDGEGWQKFDLTGDEQVSITGLADLTPRAEVGVLITRADGSKLEITTGCRIDTEDELEYYRNGGILHYVLRMLAA
jgi:aconitate hydratase A / 2-methylisocitrate dehydratase